MEVASAPAAPPGGDDAMASEPTESGTRKRQRSAAGGFAETLGREILVQARELDEASGVKFGVPSPNWLDTADTAGHWISRRQMSAGRVVYAVSVLTGDGRVEMTFGNATNAARCFMTTIYSPVSHNVSLYAFKDWTIRIPVLKLAVGFDLPFSSIPDYSELALQAYLEKRKIAAAQFAEFVRFLEDSVGFSGYV